MSDISLGIKSAVKYESLPLSRPSTSLLSSSFIETDEDLPLQQTHRPGIAYWKLCAIFLLACLAVTVALALLMDPYGPGQVTACTAGDWVCEFVALPSRDRLKDHLRTYTAQPHLAGSPGDYHTAMYTMDQLASYGLSTQLLTHEVVLDVPVSARLEIVSPSEDAFTAALSEDVLSEDVTSDTWDRNHSFIGYSASGSVTGALVYVNYGRVEDVAYVRDELGVDCAGKVALVRYGEIYRGLKVKFAQGAGFVAVLIYSDPADDGYAKGPTYPDGPWRPPSATQRGSGMFLPLCPGDPFRADASSICEPYNSSDLIPAVPVLPISFRDATPLLQSLSKVGVNQAPAGWQGRLNLTYFIGPGPTQVFVEVLHNSSSKTLYNVLASIPGSAGLEEENGDIVALGNHRDAWVFGAADPSSGSSQMLEVARGLGELLKRGWRPRRSIMLFSWDGEEHGLIGSTWLAETWANSLADNAIVYLNVDNSFGNELEISATPQLSAVLRQACQSVPNPWNTSESLLALWQRQKQAATVSPLGSGSDYTAFLDHLGIASADIRFQGPYGVYHSIYDSFSWMEREGDVDFSAHLATAQLWGAVAILLASEPLLPLDYRDYALQMEDYLRELQEKFDTSALDMAPLHISIARFMEAGQTRQAARMTLQTQLEHSVNLDEDYALQQSIRDMNHHSIRDMNHLLQMAERQFLDPRGLEGRHWFKHVIFAPGINEGYQARPFPTLYQALKDNDLVKAQAQVGLLAEIVLNASKYLSVSSDVHVAR
eukprot:g71381.t1